MPLDLGGGRSYGRRDLDISGPGAAGTARGPAPRTDLDAQSIVSQLRAFRVACCGTRLIAARLWVMKM
jgi:hypothetical protein